MPELPEVETARRFVNRMALNSRILEVQVLDPRMLERAEAHLLEERVTGRLIKCTSRHGKNLFLVFDDGVFFIHLGMSGGLSFIGEKDEEPSHPRLRLVLEHGALVLDDPRRFGRFGWTRSISEFVAKKELGPDALSLPRDDFIALLRKRRGAIKPTLLNQKVIAGIGNLYADEVLFQEKLAPWTPANMIPQDAMMGLWARIRTVLNESIKNGTDFNKLPPIYLLRHRERGGPCPRCARPLMAARIGGRTTIYCPSCLGAQAERSG